MNNAEDVKRTGPVEPSAKTVAKARKRIDTIIDVWPLATTSSRSSTTTANWTTNEYDDRVQHERH